MFYDPNHIYTCFFNYLLCLEIFPIIRGLWTLDCRRNPSISVTFKYFKATVTINVNVTIDR